MGFQAKERNLALKIYTYSNDDDLVAFQQQIASEDRAWFGP